MRNISSKTDGVGDVLPASDFNINHRIELQSIITDAGFSLDPEGGPDTDTDMLGKSITVYSCASQYYADTGSANIYEIDRVGNLQPLEQLIDGTIVFFKAANTNSGASTLDVDGIGAKDLVDNSGAALTGGEIVAGQYVQARYNSSTDDFEIIFANSLLSWKNVNDDFIPVVSGTGLLGDTTHLIEGAYFADNAHLYLGNSQDLDIYHTGSDAWIISNTGDVNIVAVGAEEIRFKTSNTDRWLVGLNGNFVPFADNSYDIGTTAIGVKNLYQSSGAAHWIGYNTGLLLVHSGTQADIASYTGNIIFTTQTASSIIMSTNGTLRWYFDPSGHLYPATGAAYDIGTNLSGIRDLFLTSSSGIYFGSSTFDILRNGTVNQINTYSSNFAIIGSGSFLFYGQTSWEIVSSGFRPFTNGTYDIGESTREVDNVYCVTLVESSDSANKEDEGDSLGLDFILSLLPKSYKMKIGKNKKRKHGLIAQDVLSAVQSLGLTNDDFGAVVHDEENDVYGLNYSQFIAPIINAIKELYDQINQ